MMMSAEEVKEYWEDFCERHGVRDELVARGNAEIDKDPEHWADQTMQSLLDWLSR